jgi:hypothetical protein
MNVQFRLKAAVLSALMFIVFVALWHGLTFQQSHEAEGIPLTSEQSAQLKASGMSESDMQAYAAKGLVFEQIQQIAGLGLSSADIDAAGGIESFGFTTGGAAEEAKTGFPSPSLVWEEAYEQISDPFYDKGPNDKGIGIQLKYSSLPSSRY